MLKDAVGASQEDMALRALREAQVDGRRLLDATEAALAADADLLSPTELQVIQSAMFSLADALETEAPVERVRSANIALHRCRHWRICGATHECVH